MIQTKACEECGVTFTKPRDMGSPRWASRRFCSMSCSAQARASESLDSRIWPRVNVDPNTGCWEWQGRVNQYGYGLLDIPGSGGKQIGAHRAAWIASHGEIPAGLVVCHACDNRKCCNPDHLMLGTIAANNMDMVAKGRHRVLRGDAAPGSRLTDEQVRDIRARFTKHDPARGQRSNAHDLANEYGVSVSHIRSLVSRRYRGDA